MAKIRWVNNTKLTRMWRNQNFIHCGWKCYDCFGKQLTFLKQLSTRIPITQLFNSREAGNINHPDVYTNVYSSSIHIKQNLETVQNYIY